MTNFFLFILMFLIIYSPKVGGRIDSLSIFCLLVIVLALITKSYHQISRASFLKSSAFIGFFFISAIYALLLIAINDVNDYYQPLRFARAMVNTLGCLALCSMYLKFNRDIELIRQHVWLCIIMHGILMTMMFFSPMMNTIIVDTVVAVDPASGGYAARAAAKRVGGLTNSWDATSAIQSLGILLIPAIYRSFKKKYSKMLVLLTIPISLFSMAISGVTGFLVISAIGIYVIFFYGNRKFKLITLIALPLLLAFCILGFKYIEKIAPPELEDSSIFRTAYMIFGSEDIEYSNAKRSATASETIAVIFNRMYFLPEKEKDFIFGLGGSGRKEGAYVIKADPGPTLNLHNMGVFFCLILYSTVIASILSCLSYRKRIPATSLFCSMILIVIFIVDLKVQYLLARNSLSLMMIALFVFWQSKRYKVV